MFGHLLHFVQVSEDLLRLVNLFHVLLSLAIDLVNVPFQLRNQLLHLVLVLLFFLQFILQHSLALVELLTILALAADLLRDVSVLPSKLSRLLLLHFLGTVKVESFVFDSFVAVA